MGTRGLLGFEKNGVQKLAYNHYDSYPSGLGLKILNFLRNRTIEQLRNDFEKLELIDTNTSPTPEQIEKCHKAKLVDLSVSDQSETDWYCLLRGAQGNLSAYIKLGMMPDNSDCWDWNWKYIIDLDDDVLNVYCSTQKDWIVKFNLEKISSVTNDVFLILCGDDS